MTQEKISITEMVPNVKGQVVMALDGGTGDRDGSSVTVQELVMIQFPILGQGKDCSFSTSQGTYYIPNMASSMLTP